MTLHERNILIKVALIVEAVVLCFITIMALVLLLGKPNVLSLYEGISKPFQLEFLSNISIFQENIFIIVIQQILFTLYSIIILIGIYFLFEKTYVIEISFFIFFALFLTIESFKLLVPILNLWNFAPYLVILLSRIIYFFRLLGLFLLLAGGVFIVTPFSRRILPILFALSFLAFAITSVTPFNTSFIQKNFLTSEGIKSLSTVAFLFFIFVIFLTYFITGKTLATKEYSRAALGITMLVLSHFLCLATANWPCFVVGNIGFLVGTFIYLKSVHSYNLWQ